MENNRSARRSLVVDDHNSKRIKQSLIYKGNYLYNKLPSDIRNKNINQYFPCDRIIKYDPG